MSADSVRRWKSLETSGLGHGCQLALYLKIKFLQRCVVVRGGAVGWDTALQVGRSRVVFPLVPYENFYWHNPSVRITALGLTQPLTEVSTRNISWGIKAAGAYGWQPYHLHVPTVLKSGGLHLQACNGIALPLLLLHCVKESPFIVLYTTRKYTQNL
jgi:hypothetical protein